MNKQKAVEYWQIVYENNENYCDENWDEDEKQAHQRWCEALKTVLDLLEEQCEWVPVSERLPDKEGRYLCTVGANYRNPREMYYAPQAWADNSDHATWKSVDGSYVYDWFVIAWMPLPEPYGEEVEHE